MRAHTGNRRRVRALAGASIAVLSVIITPISDISPLSAEAARPKPFDSNGKDDSYEIALSREQGPLITAQTRTKSQELTAADVPTVGDPAKGTFGPQIAWPVMPIHAVLMPDGRVMSYGTDRNGVQTAYYDYDVWDPDIGTASESHQTLPNGSATDIFCSAQLLLLNGDVEMYGGDNLPATSNTWNDDVNQYRPATNTLVRTGSMNRERWYSTATTLPNSEILVQGGDGGADYPEVRTADGSFRLLTGASTSNLSSGYPKNYVAPDGKVFGLAYNKMYRIDPAGNGSIASLGTFPTDNVGGTATSVMYRPGQILQVGGGPTNAASKRATRIDINGGTPQLTALPNAQYGRHWGNATVMADGKVLVSGGSSVNNTATGVAYTTEIYNPTTNSWSTAATATRMRLYHSTSLLLPDASVITMGGGTPGPETNLNAEIYYPPYLFQANGSPAARPTIDFLPTTADPQSNLAITTPDAASVARVSLVKVGSVTHSVDMDQRFIELPFTTSGTTVTATLPANAYETPPGFYMVFVINGAGVPSEAKFVKIGVDTPDPPPPPTNVVVNGSFEDNPIPSGGTGYVTNLQGWTNTAAGGVEVWRGHNGYIAADGTSLVEVDARGWQNNRTQQTIPTQSGAAYTLSFANSPRPGSAPGSNRFDVYWNGTRLARIQREGRGLTQLAWQTRTFTVTGTGSDTLSFRESDIDQRGALIDKISLLKN